MAEISALDYLGSNIPLNQGHMPALVLPMSGSYASTCPMPEYQPDMMMIMMMMMTMMMMMHG
eukprot:3681725-Amphidinium_carterae.1